MDLKDTRARVNRQLSKLHALRDKRKEERSALAATRQNLEDATEARGIVQAVAEGVQQKAHGQISRIVTRCLQAVLSPAYRFKILFEQKRGKTEARPLFLKRIKGKWEEIDPMEGSGGGVLDIAAFALRISILMLARPQRRGLVILDEPFKFVSPGYRERIAELLTQLAEEMGLQFVIVTHMPELLIGKVITLGGEQ